LQPNQYKENAISVFDDVCVLCNNFAKFVYRKDKNNFFLFTGIQSQFIKNSYPSLLKDGILSNGIMLIYGDKLYYKTDAVIFIFSQLNGFKLLSKMFKIFPTSLRNLFYNLIAKNRYKIFGKTDTCYLISKEERGRLLV